jgi:glycosyltransferase involved in cell wall biosynthesis
MKSTKILHICSSDSNGGAARAAYRLCIAQRSSGLDSQMLVLKKTVESSFVQAAYGKYRHYIHLLKALVSKKITSLQTATTNPVLHSINILGSGLVNRINKSNFDVVNLHWLGSEMLSIEEIGRINKPLVWTMHDMWTFTGSEHYDDLTYPHRYIKGYKSSTRPSKYNGPDIDAWVWRRKLRAWKNQSFNLVSPSNWLAECARQSVLMRDQNCTVIPNCIDTLTFKPINRGVARQILNLKIDRQYILFGAMNSTSDSRKGFKFLKAALKKLSQDKSIAAKTELLIFGANKPEEEENLSFPTHYLGQLNDDISLCLLYSAADIYVAPSMQDNLPNTLVEAMACGTPCVAFSIGGMTDLIIEGISGLLAKPFEVDSLSETIKNSLTLKFNREEIHKSAKERYSQINVTKLYFELYQSVINKQKTE